MKIVYVHHCRGKGGAGNSLYYLMAQLVADHDLHVISPEGPILEQFKKITHNVYGFRGVPALFTAENFGILRTLISNLKALAYSKQVRPIVELITKIDPDVVHLNEIGMFSIAKQLKRWKPSTPIVMHARTVPNSEQPVLIKLFTKKCNKYVDELICISQSVAFQYPEIKRKRVIYNPSHLSKKDLPELPVIDYQSNKLRVLFLANFFRQKGIEETIKAMIKLRSDTDIQFVIIGSNVRSKDYFESALGRLLDYLEIYPDYEKRIAKAISQYSLKNAEVLGQVENIKTEIVKCHLLIAPMHANGTPRSVFEAGVYGIPSVLALKHRIDDLIEDGVNGLVIEEKNHEALVQAIKYMAKNRDILSKFGNASQTKFRRVCDQVNIARKIEDTYKSLTK